MKRVLLLEDVDYVASSFSIVLRGEGYDVTRVRNGDEGISELESGTFDVIVTDVSMPPGMGGVEFATYVVAQENHPPIMAWTSANEAAAKEFASLGVPFYEKPTDLGEIGALVEQTLNS